MIATRSRPTSRFWTLAIGQGRHYTVVATFWDHDSINDAKAILEDMLLTSGQDGSIVVVEQEA